MVGRRLQQTGEREEFRFIISGGGGFIIGRGLELLVEMMVYSMALDQKIPLINWHWWVDDGYRRYLTIVFQEQQLSVLCGQKQFFLLGVGMEFNATAAGDFRGQDCVVLFRYAEQEYRSSGREKGELELFMVQCVHDRCSVNSDDVPVIDCHKGVREGVKVASNELDPLPLAVLSDCLVDGQEFSMIGFQTQINDDLTG